MNNPDKTTPTVGKLLTGNEGRDAIHFALAPVTANERLLPGQPVGVLEGGRYAFSGGPHVGIVDPFLKGPIEAGQRFWCFIYPGTITGLRHVFTHPAFIAKVPGNE